MERRQYLTAIGVASIGPIAGCTGSEEGNGNGGKTTAPDNGSNGSGSPAGANETDTSDDEGEETSTPDTEEEETTSDDEEGNAFEELPDAEELIDQHQKALSEREFVAEERYQPFDTAEVSPFSWEIQNGADGTLVEGTRGGSETATWVSEKVRVRNATHTYDTSGVSRESKFIDTGTARSIIDSFEFELISTEYDSTVGGESIGVFEPVAPSEEIRESEEIDSATVDGVLYISETDYIHLFNAEIEYIIDEHTLSAEYKYEITELGDVSVSEPPFVDEVPRVTGSVTEDGSALVLHHNGGSTVSNWGRFRLEDNDGYIHPVDRDLDEKFEPGETAYVFWTEDDSIGISFDDMPSETGRDFTEPIVLTATGEWGRFVIRIGSEG